MLSAHPACSLLPTEPFCLLCAPWRFLARRTCPLDYMADLGFGELELVGSFAVSMSGEAHQQLQGGRSRGGQLCSQHVE